MEKKIVEGSEVWVNVDSKSNKVEWQLGSVIQTMQMKGKQRAIVRTLGGKTLTTADAHLSNPTVVSDMTGLWHIHEPAILHNLRVRSLNDEPYTFMGPVLVAVNPLKPIADPKGILGKPAAVGEPHPYAIAELAYQQMLFANSQYKKSSGKKDEEGSEEQSDAVSQSVVVSGESGAGKTESSKMVLRHLVTRCSGGSLDKRLLCTNPVLESFGNATTLRNPNSSRFGKFLKLHFNNGAKRIESASIETYLLERSRVTAFEEGERNYHCFYEMLAGLGKEKLKELGIENGSAKLMLLRPIGDTFGTSSKIKTRSRDKNNFEELVQALTDVGVSQDERWQCFRLLAAVLLLGDIEFVDEDKNEGAVATVTKDSKGALKGVAGHLGLDKKVLEMMFSEREVKVAGEKMKAVRNAKQAREARDAFATALYVRLFDWIVQRICASLAGGGDKPSVSKRRSKGRASKIKAGVVASEEEGGGRLYIGVLDIFGFESFKRNDLEQLLIAFCNETLQATFNHQVFQAEEDLFRREGLSTDSSKKNKKDIPSNDDCMRLFLGDAARSANKSKSKSVGFGAGARRVTGLLDVIVSEGQVLNASDAQLIKRIHSEFASSSANSNPCFMPVHPKDRDHIFTIMHYAGLVSYSMGNFTRKNTDALPPDLTTLMHRTGSKFIAEVWGEVETVPTKHLSGKFGGGATKQKTVISKFKSQMVELMDSIEKTRCSFIRCVKPNAVMKRSEKGGATGKWFDVSYVGLQLKCLSIPQTAQVLKRGFPTRIPYASLTKSYRAILPKKAIKVWKSLGASSDAGFVAALFWAFEIPREDYKLGVTRVFFKSGMLASLDKVLQSAKEWSSDDKNKKNGERSKKKVKDGALTKAKMVKRFTKFHARRRWRVCVAKVISTNSFLKLLRIIRARAHAIVTIQAAWRGVVQRVEFIELKHGAQVIQRLLRGKRQREKVRKERQKQRRKIKKMAREKEKEAKLLEEKVAKLKLEAEESKKKMEVEEKQAKEEEKEEEKKKKKKADEDKKKAEKEEAEASAAAEKIQTPEQLAAAKEEARKKAIRDKFFKDMDKVGEKLTKLRAETKKAGGVSPSKMKKMKQFEKAREYYKNKMKEADDTFMKMHLARKEADKLHLLDQQEEKRFKKEEEVEIRAMEVKRIKVEEALRRNRGRTRIMSRLSSVGGAYDDEWDGNVRGSRRFPRGKVLTTRGVGGAQIRTKKDRVPLMDNLDDDVDSDSEETKIRRNKRNMFRKNMWDEPEEELRHGTKVYVATDSDTEASSSETDDQMASKRQSLSIRRTLLGVGERLEEVNKHSVDHHPISGMVFKLAIKSQRNWKKRFHVLDPTQKTISYYKKSFDLPSGSFTGSPEQLPQPLGVFMLNPPTDPTTSTKIVMHHEPIRRKPFVLEIVGGSIAGEQEDERGINVSMFLAFDSAGKRLMWKTAIKSMLKTWANETAKPGDGLGSGREKENKSKRSKENKGRRNARGTTAEIVVEDDEIRELLGPLMLKTGNTYSAADKEDFVKLVRILLTANLQGDLTEQELETLAVDALVGDEEVDQDGQNRRISMSRRGGHEEGGARDAVAAYGVQAVCPNRDCGEVNNTLSGMDCTECGTPLFPKCATCRTSILDRDTAVKANGTLFCSPDCVADDI